MAEYKHYKVEILIEEGSDLDKRLSAYCEALVGEVGPNTMEVVVSNLVGNGVYHHINRNLDLMERCLKK